MCVSMEVCVISTQISSTGYSSHSLKRNPSIKLDQMVDCVIDEHSCIKTYQKIDLKLVVNSRFCRNHMTMLYPGMLYYIKLSWFETKII